LVAALNLVFFFSSCSASSGEGSASILIKDIGRTSNESLLWGPYRSNLYFGVRPRIPKSLMTGLLWSRVDDFQSVQNSK
jgi:mannosyl-oligosaccharide glucosidase